MFYIAEPMEAEKAKLDAVAPAGKGGFGRIILWIIIIAGVLFLLYQFYG